jgi:hypothetical protein
MAEREQTARDIYGARVSGREAVIQAAWIVTVMPDNGEEGIAEAKRMARRVLDICVGAEPLFLGLSTGLKPVIGRICRDES